MREYGEVVWVMQIDGHGVTLGCVMVSVSGE